MKSEDIFNGVTDIRDDLIKGAKDAPKKKKRWTKKRWIGAVAAMLALVIIGFSFLRFGGGLTAYAIAEAKYPKMSHYPSGLAQFSGKAIEAWLEDLQAQERELGDVSDLQSFFARSSQTFLVGGTGENRVYSPLNVYLALGMLAQVTGGESREQILALLGSGSMEELRQRASDVWNCNYRDDGAITSILSNSLWLDEDLTFNRDTMNTLATDFYASSYRGEMGSKEFNKALQSWLNQQTGGFLKKQAGNMQLDSETILALASTVNFCAKWDNEFSKNETEPKIFHTPTGDVETDFMFQRNDQYYYWGEKFAAVKQGFKDGGTMWFLLPDEGVSPEELLSDSEAAGFLFSSEKSGWKNSKLLFVNKSIPKFDISSQFDLDEGLKNLGVTDIFDPEVSDFTPMTADADMSIVLSNANHAARVMIDEEGCTATAFTVLPGAGAMPPPDDEVDFVLDRPFIFCITGNSGLPLFVGIVNCPAEG